jgi:hypothetical protein
LENIIQESITTITIIEIALSGRRILIKKVLKKETKTSEIKNIKKKKMITLSTKMMMPMKIKKLKKMLTNKALKLKKWMERRFL